MFVVYSLFLRNWANNKTKKNSEQRVLRRYPKKSRVENEKSLTIKCGKQNPQNSREQRPNSILLALTGDYYWAIGLFFFFFFRFCLPLYMHKNCIISGSGDILKLILKLHAQNANHLSRVTWNVATRFIHTYNSKHTCSGKKINMILVYFLLLVLSWCIFLLSMSGQYLPHKNYLEYH